MLQKLIAKYDMKNIIFRRIYIPIILYKQGHYLEGAGYVLAHFCKFLFTIGLRLGLDFQL